MRVVKQCGETWQEFGKNLARIRQDLARFGKLAASCCFMCFGVSCSVDLNIESSRFGVSEHVKDLHVPMGATTFVAICADVSSVLTQTPKPSRVQNRQLLSRSSSHFIREWNRYTDSRLKVRRFGIQSQDIASICVALRSRASNALVPLVLHLLRPFG